jgi:hypothetical protein
MAGGHFEIVLVLIYRTGGPFYYPVHTTCNWTLWSKQRVYGSSTRKKTLGNPNTHNQRMNATALLLRYSHGHTDGRWAVLEQSPPICRHNVINGSLGSHDFRCELCVHLARCDGVVIPAQPDLDLEKVRLWMDPGLWVCASRSGKLVRDRRKMGSSEKRCKLRTQSWVGLQTTSVFELSCNDAWNKWQYYNIHYRQLPDQQMTRIFPVFIIITLKSVAVLWWSSLLTVARPTNDPHFSSIHNSYAWISGSVMMKFTSDSCQTKKRLASFQYSYAWNRGSVMMFTTDSRQTKKRLAIFQPS